MLAIGDGWQPDRVIVLTSSTDTIEKHIRQRDRPHERAEEMVRRFRIIDAEFRRLAPRYPNTVVIDRDGASSTTAPAFGISSRPRACRRSGKCPTA